MGHTLDQADASTSARGSEHEAQPHSVPKAQILFANCSPMQTFHSRQAATVGLDSSWQPGERILPSNLVMHVMCDSQRC